MNFTCLLFVTKTSKLVAMRGDRETGRPGFKCKQFVGGNEIEIYSPMSRNISGKKVDICRYKSLWSSQERDVTPSILLLMPWFVENRHVLLVEDS